MGYAEKPAKGKRIGSIKTNIPRKDCIAWEDKKGNLIYREDYENEKYTEYISTLKDSSKAIPKEMFINTLWN